MNKNNRTDEEESAANQLGGTINQIKGNVKQAIGDLTGVESLKREGTHDRVKGQLQEQYGEVKQKEAELERNLEDMSSRGRV